MMRTFAPADDARSIFRLQKRSGRYERVAIRAANQEEHLYGAKTAAGDYDNRVEGILGLTENSVTPALESLRTGKDVSEYVILPPSLLLGLQQMCSPMALDAVGELIENEQHDPRPRHHATQGGSTRPPGASSITIGTFSPSHASPRA
jgi:hypothetical protein